MEVAKSGRPLDRLDMYMVLVAVETAAAVPKAYRQFKNESTSEIEGREGALTIEVSYHEVNREEANEKMLGQRGGQTVGKEGVAGKWTVQLETDHTGKEGTGMEVVVIVYPVEGEVEEMELGTELPQLAVEEAQADGETHQREEKRVEMAQGPREKRQTITLVLRKLGRLSGDPSKRDAQLLQLAEGIISELTLEEIGPTRHEPASREPAKRWEQAAPPKLLLMDDTDTIEAVQFRFRRTDSSEVEVIKLQGACHTAMWIKISMPGDKAGKPPTSVRCGSSHMASTQYGKNLASVLGWHVCDGGFAQKHPAGQACRGTLLTKINRNVASDVQDLCQEIEADEAKRVGPLNACPYNALYMAKYGRLAPCTEKAGCRQMSASCGWDKRAEPPACVGRVHKAAQAKEAPQAIETTMGRARAKATAAPPAALGAGGNASPRLGRCKECNGRMRQGGVGDELCEVCVSEVMRIGVRA